MTRMVPMERPVTRKPDSVPVNSTSKASCVRNAKRASTITPTAKVKYTYVTKRMEILWFNI